MWVLCAVLRASVPGGKEGLVGREALHVSTQRSCLYLFISVADIAFSTVTAPSL